MRLSAAQVAEFNERGFVIVPDAVPVAALEPMVAEYHAIVDRLATELASAGKLSQLHKDEPFERRFALLNDQVPDLFKQIDIHLQLGPRTFDFMRSAPVLDLVRPIVGDEITLSPIHHVRAKVPSKEGAGSTSHVVPWHQDAAVAWPEADGELAVTMWIALSDSTKANGCVAVMPGWHKKGLLKHRQSPYGTEIEGPPFDADAKVLVEVPKGGALLMTNYTPHCSLRNQTDRIRWSIDLRYQKSGGPTGRPFHPSFVVASQKHPGQVIESHELWKKSWNQAIAQSKGIAFHRYHPKHAEQVAAFRQKSPHTTGLVVEPTAIDLLRKRGARMLRRLGLRRPLSAAGAPAETRSAKPATSTSTGSTSKPAATKPTVTTAQQKAKDGFGREAIFHRSFQFLIGEHKKWAARGAKQPLPLGTYMEFGVWNGDSMKMTWDILKSFDSPVPWKLIGFDSFEGLPEAADAADAHRFVGAGSFKSKGQEYVAKALVDHGIGNDRFELVPGWYTDSLTDATKQKLGNPRVAFVNIDVDYYSSTMQVLDWIEPLLFDGSIVYFDDVLFYNGNPHKGQLRAIREFNESRTESGLYCATRFDQGGRAYLYWNNAPVASENLAF